MASTFEILSINESQEIMAGGGGLRDVVEVSFSTSAGDTGTVRVPKTGNWQDAAREAVKRNVAQLDELRGL